MKATEMKILVLGCGNSKFSEDLYDAGYHNIVNVDYSSVCIAQMQERNSEERPEMSFIVMDITDMSLFESNSFDLVVDKSTLDAIVTGADAPFKVAAILKESQRVLKVDGIFFSISFGAPASRSMYYKKPYLSFEINEFPIWPPDC